MNVTLIPSFPAPDKASLFSVMDAVKGQSKGFQVDFVDGIFVPFKSWPFSNSQVSDIESLAIYKDIYELEADCMVANPEQYIDLLIETGFRRIIVHYGSTENLLAIGKRLQEAGILLGIAFTNNTPLETMIDIVAVVDYVQIMGIREVGQQGRPFDERTYETVSELRKHFPLLEIAVDGGVNENTITGLIKAGANRVAPGSAITKADSPLDAYKHLLKLVSG